VLVLVHVSAALQRPYEPVDGSAVRRADVLHLRRARK
jgi:hypothetical protein